MIPKKRQAKLPTILQFLRQKDEHGYLLRERMEEIRGDHTQQAFADMCGVPLSTAQDWLGAGKLGIRDKKGAPNGRNLYGIAQGCGVTTDWLLGIKGAEKYPTQTRPDNVLAEDVREHVVREAAKAAGAIPEQWLREVLPDLIPGGERLLEILVEIVADDLRANADWFREKNEAAKDIDRMVENLDPDEAKHFVARLQKAFAKRPPEGKAIEWQRLTFTNPDETTVSGFMLEQARKKGDSDA